MNYYEALEYINSLPRFEVKPGLERVEALCSALKLPHKKIRCIHVAGTNGKGSVSAMITCALTEQGRKTGLFSSPFVTDFREQLQIDGEMISKNRFASLIDSLKPHIEAMSKDNMQPTRFEALTAGAFLFFYEEGCDYCVIEAGLGGRFDSTNVIEAPVLSVITSVSLDHTGILGDTVTKIAAEKCGIIKENCDTVLYPIQQDGVSELVRSFCEKKHSKLHIPDINYLGKIEALPKGTEFVFEDKRLFVPLCGSFQAYNAVTAITALRVMKVPEKCICDGLKKVFLPARFERVSSKKPIFLDGSHNPDGGRALAQLLKERFEGKRLLGVAAMMRDKDCEKFMSLTAPCFSKIITTEVTGNPRSETAEELCKIVSRFCRDCVDDKSPHSALRDAAELLCDFDALVVFGSFYLAAEIRAEMQKMF